VGEYNSVMFRITSELKLCGENITDEGMLEKNIFHISCFEFAPATAISEAWF
jgi:hypothetical protein